MGRDAFSLAETLLIFFVIAFGWDERRHLRLALAKDAIEREREREKKC